MSKEKRAYFFNKMDSIISNALRDDDLKTLQQVYTPDLITKRFPCGTNVLDYACFNGSLNCALWLIKEAGAMVTLNTLFRSILSQDANVVKHILEYCDDDLVNTKHCYYNSTALEHTIYLFDHSNLQEDVKQEMLKIIELLSKRTERYPKRLLFDAARDDDLMTLKDLYTHRPDTSVQSLLYQACINGSIRCALWLIYNTKAKCDYGALKYAVLSCDSMCVLNIIKHCSIDIINTIGIDEKTLIEVAKDLLLNQYVIDDKKEEEVSRIIDILIKHGAI